MAKDNETDIPDLPTEITPQSQDFGRWYIDVVRKAELADYSPVKGCMVIRPYGYAIWELMQQALDRRFKETGHVNAYFPLFIPESLLMREAEHVEGFAPQVAWVTQGGNEPLEERLVVRPTSETIIGTMYAKWVQSWRDLPILINQWANVVRWEKVTRLFLRTTEFLWQEGHTAHETAEEAEEETRKMLGVYKEFAENELAMPVMDGPEDREREVRRRGPHLFDRGADARRARAAGGHVAQPRAELLEELRDQVPGARQVGAVRVDHVVGRVHPHGRRRDHGARRRRRPDPAAARRAVSGGDRADSARQLEGDRAAQGRGAPQGAAWRAASACKLDAREAQTPGWKFNEWEMRGVPLRMEIGPKDLEKSRWCWRAATRARSRSCRWKDWPRTSKGCSSTIQQALLDRALAFRTEHTSETDSYDEFKATMDGRPGFVVSPWCGSAECEAAIKNETQATIRNIPFRAAPATGKMCIKCGQPATVHAWFAKAY